MKKSLLGALLSAMLFAGCDDTLLDQWASDCANGSPNEKIAACMQIVKAWGLEGQPDSQCDLAAAHRTCGYLQVLTNHVDEAMLDFGAALELDPGNADSYNSRSILYLWTGKPEKALADVKQALKLAPDTPEYWHTLGDIYFRSGDEEKAVETWQEACGKLSQDEVRSWQKQLAEEGHFGDEADGVCGDKIIEAFRSCAKAKCKF